MADVFVVPSVRDQKGNVDGLPNTTLEAMACGRALVASRVAGIPEVVVDGQNGLLVEEKDPPQLASAISRLLQSPQMSAELGAANRSKVESELTWRRIARDVVKVYEQALAPAH
jgi:glycosyltransferase involved in cell wall biosynthesis